ncbi:MAG: CHAD domain-containing protein [Bdellovibrionales bacterium]
MNQQRQLARQFHSYSEAVEDCAKKVGAKPSTKSIHNLRIAIRRTRSVLWMIRHSDHGQRQRKLNRHLRKVGRELGEARELDVAVKDAKTYHLKISKINDRRKKIRRFIASLLSRKQQLRMRKELAKAYKKIQSRSELKLDRGLIEMQNELVRWRTRRIERKSELHRFRIVIKRARYVLEAQGQNAQPLIDLQEVLGSIHDLEVLQNLTGSKAAIKKDLAKLKERLNHLTISALPYAIRKLGARISVKSASHSETA